MSTDEEEAMQLPSGIWIPTATTPAPAPGPVVVRIHVTLLDKTRIFDYDHEFEGVTLEKAIALAESMYGDGNYACDCNRSLFIGRYCDPEYPELDCGQTIRLVALEHEGSPLDLHREGLGDVF